MSPVAFLQRPLRWLQAISRYRRHDQRRAEFRLRPVRPQDRARSSAPALDLSCWRVAFNGAEPVRAETLERFAEAFAPCGFRREAFYPCYGLAEATLIVSGGRAAAAAGRPRVRRAGAGARPGRAPASGAGRAPLVGCGQRWPASRSRSSTPRRATPCPPAQVGEIWVAGPSVAQGYWGRPRRRARTFRRPPGRRRRGPVPAHRRPGLPARRRAVRHRPAQGPDHRPRPQPLPAGHRADGRAQPPGAAARLRRGVRGRGRTARSGWWSSRRSTGAPAPPTPRRWSRAIRRAVAEQHELQRPRRRAAQARQHPQDLQRQDPAPRLPASCFFRRDRGAGQQPLDQAPAARSRTCSVPFALVAPARERLGWLERYLRAACARLLGIAPALIDAQAPAESLWASTRWPRSSCEHSIATDLGASVPAGQPAGRT